MFKGQNEALGVGLSYIPALRHEILEQRDHIDFIEFYTENFFYTEWDPAFQALKASLPHTLHGLDLSLGSHAELDQTYLDNLKRVLSESKAHWFSDHVCMTKSGGIEVGHLMPIEYSDEALQLISDKIKTVQRLSQKPFLVENITYYYQLPNSCYSESEFLNRLVTKADCGILLDLNNLYINSVNLKFNAEDYLTALPLERVVEVHLAGGSFKEGMLVDTHANRIDDKVWRLLEFLLKRVKPRGIVVERDANIPPIGELVAEVAYARRLLSNA